MYEPRWVAALEPEFDKPFYPSFYPPSMLEPKNLIWVWNSTVVELDPRFGFENEIKLMQRIDTVRFPIKDCIIELQSGFTFILTTRGIFIKTQLRESNRLAIYNLKSNNDLICSLTKLNKNEYSADGILEIIGDKTYQFNIFGTWVPNYNYNSEPYDAFDFRVVYDYYCKPKKG